MQSIIMKIRRSVCQPTSETNFLYGENRQEQRGYLLSSWIEEFDTSTFFLSTTNIRCRHDQSILVRIQYMLEQVKTTKDGEPRRKERDDGPSGIYSIHHVVPILLSSKM